MIVAKDDAEDVLEAHLPAALRNLDDPQRAIPRIAKTPELLSQIEAAVRDVPSKHQVNLADSRQMDFIAAESVHLVVTSPPYWTLKEYNEHEGQLGWIEDYTEFLTELDRVWKRCFRALTPGGRVVCVVGDVCLSRRRNNGRHTVVPLHASIQERCRKIGFDNLAPIIWHKISNAVYESDRPTGGFLGKPYEPNAVVKNDIEFVLMLRKPGSYRSPSLAKRILSIIPAERHAEWFQQIWTGITGASTRNHPAPFPVTIAERLIRMFSFVGDTVLDPFTGTGTTQVAAARCGRNSIGVEVDPAYFSMAATRIRNEVVDIFGNVQLDLVDRHAAEARV